MKDMVVPGQEPEFVPKYEWTQTKPTHPGFYLSYEASGELHIFEMNRSGKWYRDGQGTEYGPVPGTWYFPMPNIPMCPAAIAT